MTRTEAVAEYRRILAVASEMDRGAKEPEQTRAVMRTLGEEDAFFFMLYILGRQDANNDWVYARCREVRANPYGYLDIWAREHYKSSIHDTILFQDIAKFPEETHCKYSYTRPIAKAFLATMKREMENNPKLPGLWPDVFWQDPRKEAPKWSDDEGLIVKRRGNPKESTIEAWGMIDSQPTSKHFDDLDYDDIVTDDCVTTAERIKTVTRRWELSLDTGKEGGRRRYKGTRYHFADTYQTIMDRGAAIPRIYPATVDGTATGEPVLWSREELQRRIQEKGGIASYTVATQFFCNPIVDNKEGFKAEWLRYWQGLHYKYLNLYLLCDPASKKKKGSDYTVFAVIGLGKDRNYYLVDIIRDRLSLNERANVLFKLHQKYNPIRTGYEEYGMQCDREHYEDRMSRDNYRFHIDALGGPLAKEDRIKRLIPIFSNGRFYILDSCVRTNYEGVVENVAKIFVNTEYLKFPFSEHDDMLDCIARILDPDFQTSFPSGDAINTFGGDAGCEVFDYDPLGRFDPQYRRV